MNAITEFFRAIVEAKINVNRIALEGHTANLRREIREKGRR